MCRPSGRWSLVHRRRLRNRQLEVGLAGARVRFDPLRICRGATVAALRDRERFDELEPRVEQRGPRFGTARFAHALRLRRLRRLHELRWLHELRRWCGLR